MRMYVYSWPINPWIRGACMIVGKRSYVKLEISKATVKDTGQAVWTRFWRYIGAA